MSAGVGTASYFHWTRGPAGVALRTGLRVAGLALAFYEVLAAAAPEPTVLAVAAVMIGGDHFMQAAERAAPADEPTIVMAGAGERIIRRSAVD